MPPGPGSADLGAAALDLESVAGQRQRTAASFAATLAEIQDLDGFGEFMRPPGGAELRAGASGGPVVVFNVGETRSDALLLRSSGIDSVALPDLDAEMLRERVSRFRQAVSAVARARDPEAAERTLTATLEWLWEVAAGQALDALGLTSQPADGAEWPRVWWSPVGLLSLLPVHAAGYHGEAGRDAVLDRVVSSYTPTIRALRYARAAESAASAGGRSLIVAMPTTPGGVPALRGVGPEVEALLGTLPDPVILMEPPFPAGVSPEAVSGVPTKAQVLSRLADSAIVHFACHARADSADPSRSHLLLHDHRNDPLSVAGLAAVRLGSAGLAYLSACDTAVSPATELADEAIHLTSAFQLAGFPHVIGTLWEIGDLDAMRAARDFYAGLCGGNEGRLDGGRLGGPLDLSRAAEVLHGVIRARRTADVRRPSGWAAHVHVGS